jgi:acyl carrier protein
MPIPDNNSMVEKLIAIVAAALHVPPSTLTLEAGPGDFHTWDSLAQINVISEIEAEFGVLIPIERAAEIQQVRDFLRYLGKKS